MPHRTTNTDRLDSIQGDVSRAHTSIAVVENDIKHIREDIGKVYDAIGRIGEKIDSMSFTTRDEFIDYKEHVGESYVKKTDIEGIMKLWNIATSMYGKVIVGALITVLIYVAFKTIEQTPLVQQLERGVRSQEVRRE